MASKANWIRWASGKHKWLALFGGIALLLWGGSGLLHPLMVTFGPQQAVFYPPQRPLDMAGTIPVHDILSRAGIQTAAAVKVIVARDENLLQVTEEQMVPRRYFRLTDGTELPEYDPQQAEFLARHYLKVDDPIRSITFQTEFDAAYSWVNRLLPVYRVSLERDDNLSIYIYTETGAAAGLGNSFKNTVQAAFGAIHTWDWFPAQADWARVVLIGLLVGSLFAIGVTGVMLLVLIRRKKRAPGSRGWHRIAGYVLALPVLMYSSSGLYHLIQSAMDKPGRVLSLSPSLDLAGVSFPLPDQWAELSQGLNVNALSIVETAEGQFLYRLGLAPDRRGGPATASEIRNARFDGVETTGPAVYVDAMSGEVWPEGDRALALQLAARFTGATPDQVKAARLVTRFGPGYDFRNKRLPVWQIDYADPIGMTVFVDTATGVLADRTLDAQKPERFSFSFIHKWNFLMPLGRNVQNIVVSAIVALCLILMAGLGLQMYLKGRR